VDTGAEPSIDELVDGDDAAFSPDEDGGFVPASVDGDDEDFAFDFGTDEVTEPDDGTVDDGAVDGGAEADDDVQADDDAAFGFDSVPAFDPSEASGFVPADETDAGDADAADGAGDAGEADVETVEVPVEDLAALRAEVRGLRDRVATLESELEAVHEGGDDDGGDALEWDVSAREPDAFDRLDPVDGAEDSD